MKACIVFDTRYGNTEKVAKSLESGLRAAGVETLCVNAKDVAKDTFEGYDLICVGAPTEWHTASRNIKKFLGELIRGAFVGKYSFAFDTRLDGWLSGSAAGRIEKDMRLTGARLIAPHESAIVIRENGDEKKGGVRLREGEDKRFEQIGTRIGTELARVRGAAKQ